MQKKNIIKLVANLLIVIFIILSLAACSETKIQNPKNSKEPEKDTIRENINKTSNRAPSEIVKKSIPSMTLLVHSNGPYSIITNTISQKTFQSDT